MFIFKFKCVVLFIFTAQNKDNMNQCYKIKANTFEFKLEKKELAALDVKSISENQFHLLKNNRSFKAEVVTSDFYHKKYTVKINSNIYEISISDELDLLIEKMGLSLGNDLRVNEINAPMPGLILDVEVRDGQEVKEGEALLVLEAMKMENTITAPRDGVVKEISIEKGQTVEKKQLLIEME